MTSLRRRIDTNQPEIVKVLRDAGCSIQYLHAVGQGCPDILCGYKGVNTLIEIKDGSKSPSRRKLTPDEIEWHAAWRGQVAIVNNPMEALKAIGAI